MVRGNCVGPEDSGEPITTELDTSAGPNSGRREYYRQRYLKNKQKRLAAEAPSHVPEGTLNSAAGSLGAPRVDRRVGARSLDTSKRQQYYKERYQRTKERFSGEEASNPSSQVTSSHTTAEPIHRTTTSSKTLTCGIGVVPCVVEPTTEGPSERVNVQLTGEPLVGNEGAMPCMRDNSCIKKRKAIPKRTSRPKRGTTSATSSSWPSSDWGPSISDDDVPLKLCPLYSLKNRLPCSYCGALRLEHEPAGFCCAMGKILLHNPGVPEPLLSLYNDVTAEAEEFRARIRAYNSIFSFTSFKATIDKELANGKQGIFTFRAQGQVYHNLPSLMPAEGGRPCYFQLYFYDTLHEIENRLSILNGVPLRRTTVEKISNIMVDNPYSKLLRSLDDTMLDKYEIYIKGETREDQRFANAPNVDQVGAIWIEGDNSTSAQERGILVHANSGQLHKVHYYYGCYDSLMYPLLFPYGESGWHQNILKTSKRSNPGVETSGGGSIPVRNFSNVEDIFANEQSGVTASTDSKVSCREYYCYKLQMRPNETSILFDSRRLLHQFIVDMYIKLETTRLNYFSLNQKRIRADLFQGLVDCYKAGENSCKVLGQLVLLPSSFIGGPRDMKRRFLDALALVGKFGKPDLFITMTCNPEWQEIQMHLKPGQTAQDRPDLSARVFRAKFQDLKNLLFKKNHFGEVAAHVHVIEFQKRGLPHAHLLIILKSGYKITCADEFDKFVSAEIPNPSKYPELHRCVLKHMMHGPCGPNRPNSCMRDDKCKSHYPRSFCSVTTQGKDSYPIYRRRQNGRTAFIKNIELDNRWVVPYNPFLLTRYDCHINVEICTGIKAVKYLFKYIYKGHDKVSVNIFPADGKLVIDEIKEFRDARWVAAPEAIWRIYGFSLNEVLPAVINLQLHLPNQHRVSFAEHENLGAVICDNFNSMTMLTEFFTYCHQNPTEEPQLYADFPETHTWNGQQKRWSIRRNKQVIGRINAANPAEGERYFLRVLLTHVRSPTSFNDLLTFNGATYKSFKESAEARGFLQSDNWISECLLDGVSCQMPVALRRLFATVLVFCQPTNVMSLWEKYNCHLCEDFMQINGMSYETSIQETLRSIDFFLDSMGKSIHDYDLPPIENTNIDVFSKGQREIIDEIAVVTPEDDISTTCSLNNEQKHAYEIIMASVLSQKPSVYFVDGPGGTGKTFLYRALLASVRANGEIAIATATSGVAASILPGGRTAHNRFKISIDGDMSSMCNIPRQSGLAALLRKASLIIWDEAPMAKRWDIEAVDRTLRDILDPDLLFGGKVIVFGGDFRQVLPVIPRATRAESVDASLVRSYLWPQMHQLKLSTNMRAIRDSSFSEFLLRVGDGCEKETADGKIEIPPQMTIPCSSKMSPDAEIIRAIYSDLAMNAGRKEYITNRGILATRNDTVDHLNAKLIRLFPGKEQRYTSYDKAVDDKHGYYPAEFLNSLTPNGLPPHELVLKINSPIMLLRNLSPSEGLCNGTRMVCRGFRQNIIDAEITLGQHAGRRVFLHRIPLFPAKSEACPFQFERMQFPIRLCFAMTINKAQGQTIPTVGVYLPQSVFSHGQLYVALSRGTSMLTTKVLIVKKKKERHEGAITKNIVFREVLTS